MDLMQHYQNLEHTIINLSGKLGMTGAATAVLSGTANKIAHVVDASPELAAPIIEWSTVGIISGIIVSFLAFYTQYRLSVRREIREIAKRAEEAEVAALQKRIFEDQLGLKYSKQDQERAD